METYDSIFLSEIIIHIFLSYGRFFQKITNTLYLTAPSPAAALPVVEAREARLVPASA